MHPHPLDPEGSIWYSQICALVVRAAIKPQCKTKAENKAMETSVKTGTISTTSHHLPVAPLSSFRALG
uniref:Uncharacterized protein n=1 Tax=Apteryx owenii TaxID=8824 RepID=A0A8B9P3D2_APTOW